MKKRNQSSVGFGMERINRRRFVKHVAVGTVLAFGMGLTTSSYADSGSGLRLYVPGMNHYYYPRINPGW